MIGAAANRAQLVPALSAFVRDTRSRSSTRRWARVRWTATPTSTSGTAALSEGDYIHDAIAQADLIVAIGHDVVEKPPFLMGPRGPHVIHIASCRQASRRCTSRSTR